MLKLCPLRQAHSPDKPVDFLPCIGEECAWFGDIRCVAQSVLAISHQLFEMQKEKDMLKEDRLRRGY